MLNKYATEISSSAMIFNVVDDAVLYIRKFANLKIGWDYGVGGPISEFVIKRAVGAFEFLKHPFFEKEITPYSDDTIQLTFKYGDDFIDVLVSKSKYSFKHEKGIGNEFDVIEEQDNMSLVRIKQALDKILNKCISLGQSISTSLAEARKDLKNAFQTGTEGFRSLRKNVQLESPVPYVITSGTTTTVLFSYP